MSLPNSASERARSKMLLSMHVALVHANLAQERRKDGKKPNIYMYKVMYTIYSNTFQNRQTLKSLAKISLYFFLNP